MYEDRPELDTPPSIRAMLHAYGGSTPDGRPLWRLILASNKRVRAAGVRRTMPKDFVGDVPRPDKIEEGVFWMRRYKFDGWILERWFPAEIWGSEEVWRSHKSGADHRMQMLAAWPRQGDYFMLAGPWPTVEAAGDLKEHIRAYMRQEQFKPVNWANEVKAELAMEMAERERAAWDYENRMAAISRGEVSPVLGSLSLAAQRMRDRIAVNIGGPDWHLGAF